MLKVLIIDDEPLARSVIRNYLQAYDNISLAGECGDGFEGLKSITKHQPDLLFLDVQMPKISGFEMLELVEQPIDVIFTTAFDEYAVKAFELNAVDYLLKPFDRDRFDKALTKWFQGRAREDSKSSVARLLNQPPGAEEARRVVVKTGPAIKIIPAQDIGYIEAYDDYVKIHTATGFHVKKKTMNYFEAALDGAGFIRVHRSYLVNVSELSRIEPMEKETYLAILKGGARIPVSRSGYLRLKERLKL